MTNLSNSDQEMAEIMRLLKSESVDILGLCDRVYHYNKSLGLTYTTIRQEIADLSPKERYLCLENFLSVIHELKTPSLFLNFDED